MEPTHANCCVWLSVNNNNANGDRACLDTVKKVKEHMVKAHMLPGLEGVNAFKLLSWSAMSIFNTKMTTSQHTLMANVPRMDSNGPDAMDMVVNPTFTYSIGVLHRQQAEAANDVAGHGLNVDKISVLLFDCHVDSWSDRPLSLSCSLAVVDDDCKCNRLLRGFVENPLIAVGDPPRRRDLVVMENTDVAAVSPSHTDGPLNRPGRAAGHHQIRHMACNKTPLRVPG